MQLHSTGLAGCVRLTLERHQDERGFFARSFCESTLRAAGISMRIAQANWSQNHQRGTVRGMHFQAAPHAEGKIVSCVRGRIFDVAVDVRPGSPTFGAWESFELGAETLDAVYLPAGLAHGFQSLENDCLVQYWMDAPYEPTAARGVRFDDPRLAIRWPLAASSVSDRDRSWPLLGKDA